MKRLIFNCHIIHNRRNYNDVVYYITLTNNGHTFYINDSFLRQYFPEASLKNYRAELIKFNGVRFKTLGFFVDFEFEGNHIVFKNKDDCLKCIKYLNESYLSMLALTR
jgi:RNA recognition motif-containing protein